MQSAKSTGSCRLDADNKRHTDNQRVRVPPDLMGMQTPSQKWRTDRPRREIRRPALGKPVGSAAQRLGDCGGNPYRIAVGANEIEESPQRVRVPPDLILIS